MVFQYLRGMGKASPRARAIASNSSPEPVMAKALKVHTEISRTA